MKRAGGGARTKLLRAGLVVADARGVDGAGHRQAEGPLHLGHRALLDDAGPHRQHVPQRPRAELLPRLIRPAQQLWPRVSVDPSHTHHRTTRTTARHAQPHTHDTQPHTCAHTHLRKVDAHEGDDVLAGGAVGPSVEQAAQVREEGLRYGRGADGAGVAQKHAVGQRDGVHEQEGQQVLDARVVRLRVQPLQQDRYIRRHLYGFWFSAPA